MVITIIHRGIDRATQEELERRFPAPLHIRWFEPRIEKLKEVKAPLEFATCSPHYFRLLAPCILPQCTKAIYLDVDTLVLENLLPLWTLDLDGKTVAAVQDSIPCVSEAIGNWKELNLDPYAPYFNSGVLLIDLESWRAKGISQQALSLCQRYSQHLLAQQKWPQYDQYGLNVALHKNWKELEKAWNYGTDLLPEKANIIHFVGNGKIDLPTCHPYFTALFYDMLER
jgi:lipopolysaccharide biosynthesis glycosyltransferase